MVGEGNASSIGDRLTERGELRCIVIAIANDENGTYRNPSALARRQVFVL
ncbi:hypothetical protein PATSB16_43020 [Pandoraea thiooxydans]|nr:hypothetical protein PATSB16_43020 [Pandoraea thiooxydans]